MNYFISFSTIGILLFSGCYQKLLKKSINPSTHSQTSTELQTMMHQFDNLIFQHYQSELDRDQKRIDYTKEMIVIVDKLVENSKNLQNFNSEQIKNINPENFRTLAHDLEQKSRKLKTLVLNYKVEEISPTLDEINTICKRCHAEIH